MRLESEFGAWFMRNILPIVDGEKKIDPLKSRVREKIHEVYEDGQADMLCRIKNYIHRIGK